jgi:hypothetical protein
MKIKIEHLPFYGCHGRIDEIKTPNTVTKLYEVNVGQIIDLEKFKIKVTSISDDIIKLIVFDNQGVKDNESIDYKNTESELLLELNIPHKVYLDVMDCMENWNLTFLK